MNRVLTLLMTLLALCLTANAAGENQILERGRALTQDLYAGRFDALWTVFGADAKDEFEGDTSVFKADLEKLLKTLGAEQTVLEERVETQGQTVFYERIVRYAGSKNVYQLRIGFEGNLVQQFTLSAYIAPSAPPEG